MAKKVEKKVKRERVDHAVLHIYSTFNNNIFTLAKTNGDVLIQKSPGSCNFKNCKKGTPFATQTALNTIMQIAVDEFGVKFLDIKTKGPGIARDMISTIANFSIVINNIEEMTGVAYNGCRLKRGRRT